MAYSLGRSTGLAVGIVVGLIICVFVFRFMNRDKGVRTRYDEKQEIERGKGYKWGFYALAICEAAQALLSTSGIKLPLEAASLHFLAIVIGVMVQVMYCIWHDAYVGLNTNMGRFALVAIVVAGFNFAVAIFAIVNGSMMADGMLKGPFINLLCGLMFVVIGVELLLKKRADAAEEEWP